jgi:hypothetical protein
MAFDASHTVPRVTAWTTHDQLSDDQKARFGGYVLAKDEARKNAAYRQARLAEADRALAVAAGDTLKALASLLNGGV